MTDTEVNDDQVVQISIRHLLDQAKRIVPGFEQVGDAGVMCLEVSTGVGFRDGYCCIYK